MLREPLAARAFNCLESVGKSALSKNGLPLARISFQFKLTHSKAAECWGTLGGRSFTLPIADCQNGCNQQPLLNLLSGQATGIMGNFKIGIRQSEIGNEFTFLKSQPAELMAVAGESHCA
jgi:hypothetical protein